MLLTVLSLTAWAADVVWIAPPGPGDVAQVALRSEVGRPDLPLVMLRAAPTARTDADADAWQDLAAALESARKFESQLDGETLILQILEPAIGALTLVPDDVARGQLFTALAYQGFAVNRLYGDRLAEAPSAGPWRVEVAGTTVERPWAEAYAIAPEREITAYDVAEAPQRVAYAERRARFAEGLAGLVALPELGPRDTVFVDGRPAGPAPGGQLTLAPGRHWIHVQRQGVVIERYVANVQSGQRTELRASLAPGRLVEFGRTLQAGDAIPDDLRPFLDAMGEVWLARPSESGVELLEVREGVLTSVIAPPAPPAEGTEDARWMISAGVLGGWFGSQDFYLQNPVEVDPTFAAVNAITTGGYLQGATAVGPVWIGAGVDLFVPLGAPAVAITGDRAVRLRPVPHVAVGTSWLQGTVGVLFPYHVGVGARLQRALSERFEVRASGWAGFAPSRQRESDVWEGQPVVTVTGGIGFRVGR
ncbi:MAG: hypothetical protein AAGA48_11680 [Myxococcota bacterium]